MVLLSLAATAAFCVPAFQGGLTAAVNDPQSHGLVGDALLSFDEAIRLANGTLAIAVLSAAEQAQIVGTGTSVDTIRLDPMVVPTITLQSPLSNVMGGGAASPLTINGMAMGSMQRVVLQGGSVSHVLALRMHHITVMGLRIVGGQIGVDAAMPMMMSGPMTMAQIMDCEFDGQTTCGIKLHATMMQETMVMTMRTELRNMPVGFLVDDQSGGGRIMGECEFVTMDGVGIGCDLMENGSNNLSMFMLFRSTFQNGTTLIKKRRGGASTQAFMFRVVHCSAHCTGDVVDIQGSVLGLTMVHHHHSDWVAGPGARALWIHPRTGQFDIHGSEMHFVGNVEVSGNPFTQRVWQQNNDYENGTISYDVDGAFPNLLWNRYTNCTLVVPSTASSPVIVRQSELYNTQIDGQSSFAPITVQRSFRSGGGFSGQSSEVAPVPAHFLASTRITPADPQIGTAIHCASDVPPGFGLIWVFSFSYPRPTTTVEPVRFYGDPATAIVLPGLAVFQNTMTVPLPNNPGFVGTELYVTGITIPLFQQSWAPGYVLPRGGLVRPRL